MPLRPSSTPSSTAQPRGLPGPATFSRSLNWAPTPLSGPPPPFWARSPALPGLRPPALPGLRPPRFPRSCFLAPLLPQVPFLPALLMWFPCVIFYHLRKARFTFWFEFFMRSTGRKGAFLGLRVIISCTYVGLGPVRTPAEEKSSGYSLC